MAYRGTGAPQFGTGAVSYTMPRPIKGGRNELFVPIQEVYENILNKLIPAERKLRFTGEYEFSIVPTATLSQLITVYNTGRIMMWAPHSDINKIRYAVHIDVCDIIPVNGLIDYDGLKLKIRAIDVTNMIPTSDNIFRLGHSYPYLASVQVLDPDELSGGSDYYIRTTGNTDFAAINATLDTATGFNIGTRYIIKTVGGTDYTLIGAEDSNIDTVFIATGAGAGAGTCYRTSFTASGAGSGTGTVLERE